MRHCLKNKKNVNITVKYSHYPIPKVEENKKQYTTRDVNRADRARQFQHITGKPVKRILHAVDNNILHNIPILQEDVGMYEYIYGTSVPNFQGKTPHHNIQHVEPIIVPNAPKGILDGYKKVNLCCDLTQINGIGFLNTISRHIMFATISTI